MATERLSRRAGDTRAHFVKTPHLVLVEGPDDSAFLAMLIDTRRLADFTVISLGGKDSDWGTYLQVILKSPPFRDIARSVLLVRDADSSPDDAFRSAAGVLGKAGLATPSRTAEVVVNLSGIRSAVFLLGGPAGNGALEAYVLEPTASDRRGLAQDYVDAVTELAAPKNRDKAVLQAYLAGMYESPRNVEIGLRQSLVDLTGPHFDPLSDLLSTLAADSES